MHNSSGRDGVEVSTPHDRHIAKPLANCIGNHGCLDDAHVRGHWVAEEVAVDETQLLPIIVPAAVCALQQQ